MIGRRALLQSTAAAALALPVGDDAPSPEDLRMLAVAASPPPASLFAYYDERTYTDDAGAVAIVAKLERLELVELVYYDRTPGSTPPPEGDGHYVIATPKGRALLESLDRTWAR